jgi:hypothetical protein
MHDPIRQKHQSIPQLNLYIKEHIASFDIILDELPKNVVAISPISKTILYQHQTNEYKHTKTFKIQRYQLSLIPTQLIIKDKINIQLPNHIYIQNHHMGEF